MKIIKNIENTSTTVQFIVNPNQLTFNDLNLGSLIELICERIEDDFGGDEFYDLTENQARQSASVIARAINASITSKIEREAERQHQAAFGAKVSSAVNTANDMGLLNSGELSFIVVPYSNVTDEDIMKAWQWNHESN